MFILFVWIKSQISFVLSVLKTRTAGHLSVGTRDKNGDSRDTTEFEL